MRLQRMSEACHVSVTKDAVGAGKQGNVRAINDGALRDEKAHERFGSRDANGLTCHDFLL